MRLSTAVLLSAVFAACHRPTEVSGVYVNQDSMGTLFPCDNSKIAMIVKNSALAARYHITAPANEPVFVRLRGVKGHEGSIYGGQRFFDVQQILEIRPRAAGECPGIAQPLAPLLHTS